MNNITSNLILFEEVSSQKRIAKVNRKEVRSINILKKAS